MHTNHVEEAVHQLNDRRS